MYRPRVATPDPEPWRTSIIVSVPNVLPPKPVVVLWNGVPCGPCAGGVVAGAVVVGVGVVVLVVVVPRRVPMRDVEPKNVVPPDDAVVVVVVVGADAVDELDTVVPDERASIDCRIDINSDEPDEAVVDVVVVVVAPH